MILKNKRKFSKQEKEDLWDSYYENPDDTKVFNELLEAYLPLVEIIASKTKSKLPVQIEIGDLVNDGFFGLVDAIQKYDESTGNKFETYASNRIRGEINDRLRDYDWVSRYSRLKFKQVSQTEALLEEEMQARPSSQDIADRLGWDLDEVLKTQSSYLSSFSINIDEYISDSTHESFSLKEMIPDSSAPDVGFSLELSEISSVLEKSLFSLSEQQSIIVYLYIYEEMKLNEIATLLDINIKQVSKIYDQALKQMESMLHVI